MKEGKMRKFADNHRTDRQTDTEFKHWDHSILCGYSREVANRESGWYIKRSMVVEKERMIRIEGDADM